MSEENVKALRRLYERWAQGDFLAEGSLFDRYMVGVYPDPEPKPQYGLEAVRQYTRPVPRGHSSSSEAATPTARAAGTSFFRSLLLSREAVAQTRPKK